jgi:hypothetical protein
MKLLYAMLCAALFACQPKSESAVAEIEHLMEQQEAAWNEGDIEAFMASYWQNDSLVFIGSKGLTYGWQPVLENYKRTYPDKATMGHLVFKNELYRPLGTTHFWVAGQWKLHRDSDTIGGHYTLVWQKINGQWVIISDHSS